MNREIEGEYDNWKCERDTVNEGGEEERKES